MITYIHKDYKISNKEISLETMESKHVADLKQEHTYGETNYPRDLLRKFIKFPKNTNTNS